MQAIPDHSGPASPTLALLRPAAAAPLQPGAERTERTEADHGGDRGAYLSGSQVEAIVRAAENALEVRRRYQFFVWTQSNLQALLPHQLLACGAYHRQRRDLQFELFNNVPVQAELAAALGDGRSPLMQQLQLRWIANRCKPLRLALPALLMTEPALAPACQALLDGGYPELLVHGVSRPQRPSELESFFVLAQARGAAGQAAGASDPGKAGPGLQAMLLELLMPYLHGTWQRVQTVEREIHESPRPNPARSTAACGITEREREILGWLREGMSNLQIGVELGISALTVKNHVQKILRKLNAANRAQAVARAMSMNLLGRSLSEEDGGSSANQDGSA